MASPLSKDLMAGAIGESGGMIEPTFAPVPLADGEKTGVTFASTTDAQSLAELRAMTAQALLDATARPGTPRFPITIDGYFLPKSAADIFASGQQAHVPLLAGWNSQESGARGVLGQGEATPENYAKAVRDLFRDQADTALKLYPGTSADEVQQSATDLASDRFIAFSTWKWIDAHSRTATKPVYRYFYLRPRPAMRPEKGNTGPARGAAHSAEIEYAMGNLAGNDVYAWSQDDTRSRKRSRATSQASSRPGTRTAAGCPDGRR